jgi:peroxiredoxin
MAELGEFVKQYDALKALNVQVLGISVDPPDKGRLVVEKVKAPFPILSDSQHETMRIYGTENPHPAPDEGSINIPTLVLIDSHGVIRWIHQAEDYRIRAPISQVLGEARRLK